MRMALRLKTGAPVKASSKAADMEEIMRTLERDSPNLFSDQGMDMSVYSQDVDFRDPITNYDSIQGFMRNIAFLKSAFNPTYKMLGIRLTNTDTIEARWSMGFDVLPIKNSLLGRWWQPHMEFTGTTEYGVDFKTGLINKHYDKWDSVQNNEFFSVEAFQDVLRQMFNLQRTPQIPSPEFTLVKRKAEYCVRDYAPFVVAETEMRDIGRASRNQAFMSLVRYLKGPPDRPGGSLEMTTPVLSGGSYMRFVLPVQTVADSPPPEPESPVQIKQMDGGLYAVIRFSGNGTELEPKKRRALQGFLARDGICPRCKADGQLDSILLQYNDPRVKPPFRRNELLVPVDGGFDLWLS